MAFNTGFAQDTVSSLTGNLPRAMLFVRNLSEVGLQGQGGVAATGDMANLLQDSLLKETEKALNMGAVDTFSSLTEANAMLDSGFLAMEVQYNPKSLHFQTQAGKQVTYSGGTMGSQANNQLTQVHQPVATTLSLQLIFDDTNVYDAFMLQNLNATAGNAVSAIGDIVSLAKGKEYSVQSQIEGLLALLTMDETRNVIFHWGNMSFRGELTGVNTNYTMFNKKGNPIRGVVNLTIRQGNEEQFHYDEDYWNRAFDKLFGEAGIDTLTGGASTFSKITQNNLLNLNI